MDIDQISSNYKPCEYASNETGTENGFLPRPLPWRSNYVHYKGFFPPQFSPQFDRLPISIHLPALPCHTTASVTVIGRAENMANLVPLAPSHKRLSHRWDFNSQSLDSKVNDFCFTTGKPLGEFWRRTTFPRKKRYTEVQEVTLRKSSQWQPIHLVFRVLCKWSLPGCDGSEMVSSSPSLSPFCLDAQSSLETTLCKVPLWTVSAG